MTSPSDLRVLFGTGDHPEEVQTVYLETCDRGHIFIAGAYSESGRIMGLGYDCPWCELRRELIPDVT